MMFAVWTGCDHVTSGADGSAKPLPSCILSRQAAPGSRGDADARHARTHGDKQVTPAQPLCGNVYPDAAPPNPAPSENTMSGRISDSP